MAFTETTNTGTSNGATDVNMVAASANTKAVTGFTVVNADTASATVTIKLDDTVNERNIISVVLASGDQLYWGRDDTPIYITDSNTSLQLVLGGTVTTNELPFTVHYAVIT